MILITLLRSAHALTCGADPDCLRVLDMVADVNAAAGPVMSDGASRADLRPATYVPRFQALNTLLQGGACTIEGHIAGDYHPVAVHGGWDGGPLTNGVRTTPRTFQVTMAGGDDVGTGFSAFHESKRLVADRTGGGFIAGYWARLAGDNGVFLGVHGSCTGAPQDALGGWFPGGVAAWPAPALGSELVQNHDGVCVRAQGCNNLAGTAGNPQEMVECFTSALGAPLTISSVDYVVSPDFVAPDTLTVQVYEWIGSGPPGAIVQSVVLSDPSEVSGGPHTVGLPGGVTVGTRDFCVGINGLPVDDGFRLAMSATQTRSDDFSWFRAPLCGITDYTTTSAYAGNWCTSAQVEGTL